ncbi:MAG: IPT/TIG domain-containing protein, partial [Silvibacterium sp.]
MRRSIQNSLEIASKRYLLHPLTLLIILLAIPSCATAAFAQATIGFAQKASSDPQTSAATVNVSYPSAQTAGNLNIVVVGWNDTTATVQSVTDSAGNKYSPAVGPTSGAALSQSIYYASNIAGGTNTVTVTFSQAAAYPDIRILEYRGVNTLDVMAGASGSGTTASSGSAATTSANELIFGADTIATSTKAAGSGFTARIVTSPDSDLAEDKVVTTAGGVSATATLSSTGAWVMQMATFAAVTASAPSATLSGLSCSNGTMTGAGMDACTVTLTGAGGTGGMAVSLSSGSSAVTVPSSVTVPAGASSAGFTATVSAVTTSQTATLTASAGGVTRSYALQLTAAAPALTVTSVSPNNGSTEGGTAVTITGTNFASGATVSFGGTAATNVVVVNSTTITAMTPAGSAGAVTVTVTNSGGLSGSLTNGFTYEAPGAISFAQVASSDPQTPTATVTVSYPSAQTLGDMNIVVVGWNGTTATVQSVTDSAGNAYKLAIGPTSGTALRQSIYYAPNIAGGSNTVTVTFSQAAAYPDIRILEYRGVTTLDVTAGASGSSTSP